MSGVLWAVSRESVDPDVLRRTEAAGHGAVLWYCCDGCASLFGLYPPAPEACPLCGPTPDHSFDDFADPSKWTFGWAGPKGLAETANADPAVREYALARLADCLARSRFDDPPEPDVVVEGYP